MIPRRSVLMQLLLAPLLALPERPFGQTARPARIAWIAPGSAERQTHYLVAFKQGMSDLGLFEGRQYAVHAQFADGYYERFPAMVEAALQREPAVIVVVTIASVRAAQRATASVPIVFISTNDPVGSGLIDSLAHPGGHTTGISNQAEDVVSRYVDLLRDALPQSRRVAALLNPGNPSNAGLFESVYSAARRYGITVYPLAVDSPPAVDRAFEAMARAKPDALLMLSDAMLFDAHPRIALFALKQRIPTIGPSPEQAESGMLLAYGASRPAMYRRAADYVKRILAGAKPGDMPVEQPTQFELVVNQATAKALGLVIPPLVMLRADRVIE